MYHYAKNLQGVKFSWKGKWHAQVTIRHKSKDKHLIGYVLFDYKSIKDPAEVAHEIIHCCQFYFHYHIHPLCMTMLGQNHETFAHSHTFMMRRVMEEANKL